VGNEKTVKKSNLKKVKFDFNQSSSLGHSNSLHLTHIQFHQICTRDSVLTIHSSVDDIIHIAPRNLSLDVAINGGDEHDILKSKLIVVELSGAAIRMQNLSNPQRHSIWRSQGVIAQSRIAYKLNICAQITPHEPRHRSLQVERETIDIAKHNNSR
jgi:Holliday junction resolvasome RuvABC ATP-dependent DNA helicase subunit